MVAALFLRMLSDERIQVPPGSLMRCDGTLPVREEATRKLPAASGLRQWPESIGSPRT